MLTSVHPVVPLVERRRRLIEKLRSTAPRPPTAASPAERTGVSISAVERDMAAPQSTGALCVDGGATLTSER